MEKKQNKFFTETEFTTRYRKRVQEQRKKEEEYWNSMHGPVTVFTIKDRKNGKI
jgi:hypothetical protein